MTLAVTPRFGSKEYWDLEDRLINEQYGSKINNSQNLENEPMGLLQTPIMGVTPITDKHKDELEQSSSIYNAKFYKDYLNLKKQNRLNEINKIKEEAESKYFENTQQKLKATNFINDLNNQGQTNQTQHSIQNSTLLLEQTPQGVTVQKAVLPSIENTSFYQNYLQQKQLATKKGLINNIKGLFGPLERSASNGALDPVLGKYSVGKVEALKFAFNDLMPALWNMGTGKVSMTDPTGKYAKEAELIRNQNTEETQLQTQDRIAMNQSAINGGRSYDAYAASQDGPSLIGTQNNPTYLLSDPEKGERPVLAYKGTKLSKQDNFNLNYLSLFK